jgi:hypothetical protein
MITFYIKSTWKEVKLSPNSRPILIGLTASNISNAPIRKIQPIWSDHPRPLFKYPKGNPNKLNDITNFPKDFTIQQNRHDFKEIG